MSVFKNLFRSAKAKEEISRTSGIARYFNEHGIQYKKVTRTAVSNLQSHDRILVAYLYQLDEEGYLTELPEDWLLTWDQLYRLMDDADHQSSLSLLRLPPLARIAPSLVSSGSLSDPDFTVAIKGWKRPGDVSAIENISRNGAVVSLDGGEFMLSDPVWRLVQAVRELRQSQKEALGEHTNQIGWSKIRKLACLAGAGMDGFLTKTIVLRPDSLHLKLRKSDITSDPVIEVQPKFDDEPENWLSTFDEYQYVQDRYHIVSQDGSICHVLISPEVKSVLQTVKKMPARRVTGDNALTFIKNPYAVLGDDAVKVLDEEEYENERNAAGIYFYRFAIQPAFSESGKICQADVILEPISEVPQPPITLNCAEPALLASLIGELRIKSAAGLPCGFWKGYELELSDFNVQQLTGLEQFLERWQRESAGEVFDTVFDLSQYGCRVVGIGIAERITSPFLAKGASENWLPADILTSLGLDGNLLEKWDSANREHYELFKKRVGHAEIEELQQVYLPGLEIPLSIRTAKQLLAVWSERFKDPKGQNGSNSDKQERAVLLIENNIDAPGYIERRAEALKLGHAASPLLPEILREDVQLREHQMKGVAWLQHLFGLSPAHVAGCLLADDMGLGKTLQLLTFICSHLEAADEVEPVLIVAPVSLLDNWERELRRFFYSETVLLLKLYGQALSEAKFKKHEIPDSLRQQGIHNLLKPGWRNGCQVVLTTYETLRDQEFSLARQRWGIVICDEAQKIKNPAALVTQAAKAIPARFRVACTGTPVENSLTDLWCLFDFIQPGLLGSLNEFGRIYRQPIECQNEQDVQALNQLKALIEPQILRRTKADVAKDLPAKIEDNACKSLQISSVQDQLYRSELAAFEQKRSLLQKAADQNVAILGLLHTMKLICAHPSSLRPEDSPQAHSPKLRWLMSQLELIKQKNEKAIIFTELRDVQRTLQLAILDQFGFQASIVNGDTSASSERGISRQSLIDEFQKMPGFGVIILSTTAVGFGVNVQAANHVIHFTRPWNPAKEDQATDRAYRIGQEKDVYVYYPTVKASDYKTFEETLDVLLNRKRALASDMLNGSGDVSIAEFIA